MEESKENVWIIEFEMIVPEFPGTVILEKKVNETTFLVRAEKLPQEWILSDAIITKM